MVGNLEPLEVGDARAFCFFDDEDNGPICETFDEPRQLEVPWTNPGWWVEFGAVTLAVTQRPDAWTERFGSLGPTDHHDDLGTSRRHL
jgi:hypothetical protein